MKRERPINADLPELEDEGAAEETKEKAKSELPEASPTAPEPGKPSPPPKRRRQPKPLTPKLLAALVLIAVAFIVAAVLGGTSGSDQGSDEAAPAPTASTDAGGSGSEVADSLGYPAFATNNTTRIGGSDPATIAAAAALAVYPSTTSAQRPHAVTLVPEGDWEAGIAASVLMAEPVRAPVLIEGADATSEALKALDPVETRTVGGGSAAKQAAQVAELRDRLFGSAPDAVIVAPISEPAIAMPAAAWAARSGDPVLFAGVNDLPAATAAALRRHTKVPVYVLGPSSAISSEVLRGIGKIVRQVKRISGEDPVANAIAFARYSDGKFGWNVNDPGHGFVLSGDGEPLDAAAAAALSGSGSWGPLLLTDSATKLPAELRSYFLDVKPGYTDNPTRAFYNRVWVIGDEERIDVNQQAEVNELAELTKIGGEE
ncbi:MAG TPA: cell wall-binding repeat-containing protein [Solirubrobacterales bacterium]|nr:cell wall-binding repeat-containing protein [Solirubrobacterales bacterium]